MRLMLAPRSQRALSICVSLMQHGIEKLPASYNFDGDRLCKSELQDPLMEATETSPGSPFLDRSSLKNFKWAGASLRASKKGLLTYIRRRVSKNRANLGSN